MANNNAQIHDIELKSLKLNVTRNKTDITPYDGFIKNNSPYYGDVLSTFYTKKVNSPAQDAFVNNNGAIYYLGNDGCLYKQYEGITKKLLTSNWFCISYPDDNELPTEDIPSFDNYVSITTTGTINKSIDKVLNAWTSDDEGVTYVNKVINSDTSLPKNNINGGTNITLNIKNNSGTIVNSYSGVPVDDSGNYIGGICVPLKDNVEIGKPRIRALYNNRVLQGFSMALDDTSIGTLLCGLGVIDPDKPYSFEVEEDNCRIKFFLSDGTFCSIGIDKDPTHARMTIANNRYIICNYGEYYNCWDVVLDKPFHFANDYNNRAISYGIGGQGFSNTSLGADGTLSANSVAANSVAYVSATGIYSNFSIAPVPFSSTQFAIGLDYVVDSITLGAYIPCGYSPDNQWVEYYRGKLRDSTYPLYVCSYNNVSKQIIDTSLVDTRYTNGFYGIPSIFATFTKSYLNKSIINDWNYAYSQTIINGTKAIFAYSADTELEHVQGSFIIQGQQFNIINSIIYSYYESDGSMAGCVNIDNMQLVGNTPYNAIFWSQTNRTFYSFTGDNMLRVLLPANEINHYYDSGYNPNTMSVYCSTDVGCYIFTQEQLIKIPGVYKNIYPLSTGMALLDNNGQITYYAYDSIEGYTKQPIELQTLYYGQGGGIVSINDCVYIRLFRDGTNPIGSVTLKASTLRQGTYKTDVKVFEINENMWDLDSDTLLLRYQPKFQEGEGFSVSITSDFSIVSLKISEQPIAVVKSKYNI